MKTEIEINKTSKRTETKDKSGQLEASVSSDTADLDPALVLSLRRWTPFIDSTVIIDPHFARRIGEMLIEHADRLLVPTTVGADKHTNHLGATE